MAVHRQALQLAAMHIDFRLQMRYIILLFLTILCASSHGQFRVSKLDSSSLPKDFKYIGHITNAVSWRDSLGLNYVITTETGKIYGKEKDDEDLFDASLYAYHYVIRNDSIKLIWKIYDYNKDCDLDLDLYFINNALSVTDLDKNGVAEIWVMYKNSCHVDVSPVLMKIIMYEGAKKFAVRGTTRVQVSTNSHIGGEFTFDDAFKAAPAVIRQYAEKLWKQQKIETGKH